MVGIGPGGSLGGRWVQTRTHEDARLLEEERKLFGKPAARRSRQANLIFAAVVIALILAAMIGGFLT